MQTTYDAQLGATVTRDDSGKIRGINYPHDGQQVEYPGGREGAAAYVHTIAEKLDVAPEALRRIEQHVSYLDPRPQDVEYRFSEEKAFFDSATYAYYQTYLNTPFGPPVSPLR